VSFMKLSEMRARRKAAAAREVLAARWRAVAEAMRPTESARTCRGAGCNGCCRGTVDAPPDEIAAAAEVLTAEQWARVMAHRPADPTVAICPLLEASGACGVYAVRPTTCRIYVSIDPPDRCWPERVGIVTVRRLMPDAVRPIVDSFVSTRRELIVGLQAVADAYPRSRDEARVTARG
jgi:hypothetical protein